MLKSRKVTDVFGMRIFTDDGHYYGDVEEAIFQGSKVYGWRVKATKNSQLSNGLILISRKKFQKGCLDKNN